MSQSLSWPAFLQRPLQAGGAKTLAFAIQVASLSLPRGTQTAPIVRVVAIIAFLTMFSGGPVFVE